MKNIYIGWDNGSTGSIGIVSNEDKPIFLETPIRMVPNYTKEIQMIGRLDLVTIKKFLLPFMNTDYQVRCLIERPFMSPVTAISYEEFMKEVPAAELLKCIDTKKKIPTVNMMLFKASLSAHRTYEASIILLESLKISFETVDSKAWQKHFLGNNIKGSKALKDASKARGFQVFPDCEAIIKKHGDADGLFIAEFARYYYNQ